MEVLLEEAAVADATEILTLQKPDYQSEAAIYNDYNIPPLTQTRHDIKAEFENHVFLKVSFSGSIIGSVRAKRKQDGCEIGEVTKGAYNQRFGVCVSQKIQSCITNHWRRTFPPQATSAAQTSPSSDVIPKTRNASCSSTGRPSTKNGGAADINPERDHGFMYNRNLADPDGHA